MEFTEKKFKNFQVNSFHEEIELKDNNGGISSLGLVALFILFIDSLGVGASNIKDARKHAKRRFFRLKESLE